MLFGSIETYAERVRRAEQSLFGSTQRFALSWATAHAIQVWDGKLLEKIHVRLYNLNYINQDYIAARSVPMSSGSMTCWAIYRMPMRSSMSRVMRQI